MQLSLEDFWKLTVASELLSPEECDALAAEFAALKGAAGQANVRTVAQWLVARGTLTAYQANVLVAGRPGPFVLGKFVVIERIESGRLSPLLQATYEGSQPVLLVFLQQLTEDSREYQQYAELAQSAAAVKNPHVSRTYRATRQRGQSFIVAESLVGQTLEQQISDHQPATQAACQIGFQVALGLVALHAPGLTHGGVCPRNVWIDTHGAAKLMQFPLVQPPNRLKRFEAPLVDYLAPEWSDPQARATPLVDLYSLGCLLYRLIAGRVPFPGGSAKQKLARHRSEFPQRLDQLNLDVPEELADLVSEMLAKDPLLRCQTATEAAHLLARFAAAVGGRATPPKADRDSLTPGYGAWKAPGWQPPPQTSLPPKQPSSMPARSTRQQTAQPSVAETGRETATPAESQPAGQPVEKDPVARGESFPFVVTDAPVLAANYRPPTSRSGKSLYLRFGSAGVLILAILTALWLWLRNDDTPTTTDHSGATVAASTHESESPDTEKRTISQAPVTATNDHEPGAENLVGDDGQTPWAPPTAGQPVDVAYLPSGAQLIVALRPAELMLSPEGPKLLAGLGPAGRQAVAQLQQTIGVPWSDVEQLVIGFVPDDNLLPQANYVVRLREAVPRETWLDRWQNPAASRYQQKEYFEREGRGYYLPESAAGRIAAIGPLTMLKQMLEFDGRPLLRSGIEALLRRSDELRQITLVFTPSYLLTDGRSLLVGHLDQLHAPLRAFLDESIEAVLVSAHVGDELFVEFRAVAPIDRQPLELQQLLSARWDQIPERVESHIAALRPQPHGQLVIHRFPRMLQLTRDYTRDWIDDGQVVLASYLPASAGHNLLMGAELTLLETSGVDPAPGVTTPLTTRTAAEALGQKITLSFPREALDRAIEMLSRELDLPIVIVGADLQLEGITKNQSLNNVDQREQPADDVLRKILKLANPDGKLVYQIKPDDSGRETVFITTRAAVQKRGESLPAGF